MYNMQYVQCRYTVNSSMLMLFKNETKKYPLISNNQEREREYKNCESVRETERYREGENGLKE